MFIVIIDGKTVEFDNYPDAQKFYIRAKLDGKKVESPEWVKSTKKN